MEYATLLNKCSINTQTLQTGNNNSNHKQTDVYPCEVANVEGYPLAGICVDHVGGCALAPLRAPGALGQAVQIVPVLWGIPIVGRRRDDVIIQVDLLVDGVILSLHYTQPGR